MFSAAILINTIEVTTVAFRGKSDFLELQNQHLSVIGTNGPGNTLRLLQRIT